MRKKYILRLTEEDRKICDAKVGQKARRARILLQTDVDGWGWTNHQVADTCRCRTRTVENVRRRCVLEGIEMALNGKQRISPPVPKLINGEQEAQLIVLRLGPPPPGYRNWSLRLLAQPVVELEIVDSISHKTARRTLKRNGFSSRKVQ